VTKLTHRAATARERLRGCVFALALVCAAAAQPDAVTTARKALDYLLAGRYAELSALSAPSAKQTLTPQFLRDRPGAEVRSFGKLGTIGAPVVAKDGRNTLVSFPVQFEKVAVNVQFTLNESAQLAGLFFRPANAPLPPVWRRPSYSNPESFQAREVVIDDDAWKLGGTLLIPAGKPPFPGVVLVHGPGPNDRDETIYANKVFADIAEGLASRGIAVLRYDKRTKVYSQQMSEINYTVREETIEDAIRAISLLRRQPEIARLFVLGHSLGGYLLPRIAPQAGKLAGLIFLAANARPVEVMALEQNEYVANLNNNPSPETQKRLADLRAEVLRVRTLDPHKSNPPVLMGLPLAYLIDLKGYDPLVGKNLKLPMLFLQGERDFQVTTQDFNLWKAAMAGRRDAAFHSYPALNHLFITGKGGSSPGEYRVPGNVSGEVVRDIADWVQAQRH
jgi:dienelactone hydrolase